MNLEVPIKDKINSRIEYVDLASRLTYLKITPHQSTRNFKSVEIAKLINRCYKSGIKRFYKENGKIYFEAPTKVAYYIYISATEGIQFFLIIPSIFESMFMEKISSVWEKVEVTRVNDIPQFDPMCSKASLVYTKDSALSLEIADKKSNEILNSQLNIIDILEGGDKVGIYYNFNYINSYHQMGFKTNYNKAMQKIKEGKSLEKPATDKLSILKFILRLLVLTVEEIKESFGEILGVKCGDTAQMEQFNKAIGIIQKKDLSNDTKDKAQLEVIDTQILLMSQSNNKENEKMNLNSLSQSFTILDGDNTIRPKTIGIKRKIDLTKPKLPIQSNIMSTEEVGNLISQPGREIINKYKIFANTINEEKIPKVCENGYIKLGVVTFKGFSQMAYLNPNPDQDTGLVITGKQGSGKTEHLKNYANDCVNRKYETMKNGDSLVVLDYIGNNDLSNTIEKIVPKNQLISIDLSIVDEMESIAYPEKYYTADMDIMSKLDVISEKAQLMAQLINSFNYGQELTSAMRRFFISACNVVYMVNQYACFGDILDCLEDYSIRMNYISKIPSEFQGHCEKHIENLYKLNAKVTTGENKGEDSGETLDTKIDRILDRVSIMRESPRLEHMLTKDPRKNINFEKAFNEGKVILVKMRQDKFGTTHMRNMLTMFFMTRIWEACVNRYSKSNGEELRRVHFIIDEPHQVPKVTAYLEPILPQMRKFRLKPVFATQSLQQLIGIYDSIKSAGFSFMLLAGSDKVNFNILKSNFAPYEVDDLLSLERFHSLNLVPDDMGVLKPFVTKLPPKLKI